MTRPVFSEPEELEMSRSVEALEMGMSVEALEMGRSVDGPQAR